MAGKRSIFEEVETTKPKAEAPKGGMIDAARRGAPRGIRIWLMILFALVVIMIAVGGLTRLTDSGLSITEWAPISGAVPPLTPEDWTAEFEAYKAIPEYQLQNQGMSLEAFKVIYWWEWGHRQLGRMIGLVWAVGFLGFLAAQARRFAALDEKQDRTLELATALQLAMYGYRDAGRKINLYRDGLLPKADEAVAATATAYQAGTSDILDLLDAQRVLLEFQLALERALADSSQRLAEIEMLVGRPLPRMDTEGEQEPAEATR